MRNILTVLALCVLAITTSNVFAEFYDESKRTERLGLSFYDGAPMYVFKFNRPQPQPPGWNNVDGVFLSVTRLRTGDNLSDYGYVQSDVSVRYVIGNQYNLFTYGYNANGDLVILDGAYSLSGVTWLNLAMQEKGPAAIARSRLRDGDLAVEAYDEIAPKMQAWARRGRLLAIALLAISTGLNKFRELTSGGAQATVKEEKKADGAASSKEKKPKVKRRIDTSEYLDLEHESPYRLRTPRELREERARQDLENVVHQRIITEQEALREAYISGDYWGKSFSDEVRQSNRELYEAFDKMDPFTRRLLIQKFDEMSFTKEATLLKSYNKNVYGFADDNIGNPFEDDEEDGEPPF